MIKIGIVGSSFNLKKDEIMLAKKLGKIIAEQRQIRPSICFDTKSLPVEAGKEIVKASKIVTCFTSNKMEKKSAEKLGFSAINLNLPRLFREIRFVKSIDVLLVCGGGSGTLMEVTFAYQLGKPIFLLTGIGGSVEVFRDKFLDKRRRTRINSIDLRNMNKLLLTSSRRPSSSPPAG